MYQLRSLVSSSCILFSQASFLEEITNTIAALKDQHEKNEKYYDSENNTFFLYYQNGKETSVIIRSKDVHLSKSVPLFLRDLDIIDIDWNQLFEYGMT
ncbi:hypothetical protein RO3G_05398 [Rhizopus delemar RA 99-880]|uniref:Uncharacterized protein n=1 Tax=Rhizopus delemar (strain RA 99-880 / ATCC MYA-4621 / FGSC 9543 / NRRL 43880) TaxID=246409 RepID=I1BWW3_RHIO9|nr:hypothetical protein RO3G_05398 [Rhizopus delemar RA 99-880]|eukprot:EIE80693.1 hypothetical protein RO3G_05398 [Rhizopus delemar RA 99-880]